MSVLIRRALVPEVPTIARLYRRTAEHAWDFLYPHTPREDLAHFGQAFRKGPVWIAERDGTIVGFCATRRGWIDHFYVAPEEQGRGFGQRLIARALKGRRRVRLWTFQRNARSRRFYALQGFREVLSTDGHANEEKEPDVLLEWLRPAPS
jgi:putative acetyltransferase